MNLVNGFTGLFSLGQAGFMAIGAYVVAMFTTDPPDGRASTTWCPSTLAGAGAAALPRGPHPGRLVAAGLAYLIGALFCG